MQEYSFSRLFVPWNIRSHDGTFVLGTIHSLEHSLPGPLIPGTFILKTIHSLDRSFPGTFVPGTVRSVDQHCDPDVAGVREDNMD